METDSIFSRRAEPLAKMMDTGGDGDDLWREEDLGAILAHQLAAAVEFDLGATAAPSAEQGRGLSATASPSIKTFGDLFFSHPSPPVELLRLAKQFAKEHRRGSRAPMPDEVSTVLYFLAIVVAMLKYRTRISGLDDEALRHGLDWALGRSWLDDNSRQVFGEARKTL
jgi:hypothetical protein